MRNFIGIIFTFFAMALIFSCSDESITESLPDTIAPTIRIIKPVNNSEFYENDIILIEAEASDNEKISSVVFFIDNDSIGVTETNPFIFNWNTSRSLGSYSIKAKATDGSNNITFSDSINILIKEVPLISLITPNGGEYWLMDSTYSIVWSSNTEDFVNIDLYLENEYKCKIAELIQMDSVFNWLIPDSLEESDNYRVKIYNDNTYDFSDSLFNIFSPFIKVTTPNGGEIRETGNEFEIKWDSNYANKVKIDLFFNGSFLDTITTSTENDGSFYVNIPYKWHIGGDFTIRISDINEDTYDFSDSLFVISPFDMVYIRNGNFAMGDRLDEGMPQERPVHTVSLDEYFIGKNEVTQFEWSNYLSPALDYNYGSGDEYPVYYVSWYSTLVYCNKRSIDEGLVPCYSINNSNNPDDWGEIPTSLNQDWDSVVCDWNENGYRLPTEAEWEYAARAGLHNIDNLRYSGCDDEINLYNYAWFQSNSGSSSHSVSTKIPNQLKISDMSGNLNEWCWDWYNSTYYEFFVNNNIITNPKGSETGTSRVLRGGYWNTPYYFCTVSKRDYRYHYNGYYYIGFRIVRRR